ncbi:Uncharacterised protein [Neisseria sicca]|nr:Uncharacterised protein [Neisseria sicca]
MLFFYYTEIQNISNRIKSTVNIIHQILLLYFKAPFTWLMKGVNIIHQILLLYFLFQFRQSLKYIQRHIFK